MRHSTKPSPSPAPITLPRYRALAGRRHGRIKMELIVEP